MQHLLLALEWYFAAVLGVAGLAKAQHPERFAATMRRHRILPGWAIPVASRVVPWLQLATGAMLLLGAAPVATAAVVLAWFLSFLLVETILVLRGRPSDCGCYGVAYPQEVDGASVAATGVLVLAGTFHLWGVTHTEALSDVWRLPGLLAFGAGGLWLCCRMVARRRPEREHQWHGGTGHGRAERGSGRL